MKGFFRGEKIKHAKKTFFLFFLQNKNMKGLGHKFEKEKKT